MMGHRTGTPMRLVSPAPVLVPGAGPRQQAPPTIYQPPQPQGTPQTIYSQQNNSNVGGKRLHATLSCINTHTPTVALHDNHWTLIIAGFYLFLFTHSLLDLSFLSNLSCSLIHTITYLTLPPPHQRSSRQTLIFHVLKQQLIT